MVKIAFHADELTLSGASTTLYEYATYNETLLLNRSLVLVPRNGRHHPHAMKRFRSRFAVAYYETERERDELLAREQCAALYCIKRGHADGVMARNAKTLVHCTSTISEPHGDVYAAASASLARSAGADFPCVPPIVCLPDVRTNLRESLGIPSESTVFGRLGARDTFNLDYAKEVVVRLATRRPDVAFAFLNTAEFCEHPRVFFLTGTSDPVYKTQFINTCDAMIHASATGEDLGLACAEFSAQNRPVITCEVGPRTAHLDVLGDRALGYRDADGLEALLDGFRPDPSRGWDVCSERFNPLAVMREFERVFLEPLGFVERPHQARRGSVENHSKTYCVLANDVAGRHLLGGGDWEPHVTACLNHVLSNGDHVADVGAGVGVHTLTASERVGKSGRVLAFEPQSVLFELLRENCRNNRAFNVRLFHVALAHERGDAALSPVDYLSDDLDVGNVHIGGRADEGERVLVFPLDDIATKEPLRLVRIDVEGAEVFVLRGAAHRIMADRPMLLLGMDDRSTTRFHYTREGLRELLRTLEYSVFLLDHPESTEHLCVPNEQLGALRSKLGHFLRPFASTRPTSAVTVQATLDFV